MFFTPAGDLPTMETLEPGPCPAVLTMMMRSNPGELEGAAVAGAADPEGDADHGDVFQVGSG